MKKTFGLLILCGLALVAADNPFVGTWKLNVAKSKFSYCRTTYCHNVLVLRWVMCLYKSTNSSIA